MAELFVLLVLLSCTQRYDDNIEYFQTALAANPNADDVRVPMAISQATAFTILSTESLLAFQNHSPSTGLAARQEEGLRALLRLVVSMESIVTCHEVGRDSLLHTFSFI